MERSRRHAIYQGGFVYSCDFVDAISYILWMSVEFLSRSKIDSPFILESALSFPCPTSTKSKEAFPCVNPKVNILKSSGLSRLPSRLIACDNPPTFAQTFAITSISSASPLQFCNTVSLRMFAACLPPSRPWDINSSVNCRTLVMLQAAE